MEFSKLMLFTIWLIVVCLAMSLISELLTMSNNLCNAIGILIIPIVVYVSLRTSCFTNIKIGKRNEKSN